MSTETFLINFNYSNLFTPSASLFYNNTEYVSTNSTIGTNNATFSKTMTIPSSTTGSHPFYWRVGLTNATGTYYFNSTNHSQSLNSLLIVYCNATYPVVALNFTIKEEATFFLLNSSLEANLKYWLSGSGGSLYKTFIFQNLSQNQSNYQFCFHPNSSTFRITGTVSYVKEAYDRREYIFSNALLNNVTQNIPLYLASTATTDIFTFTVLDEANNPVSGAIIRVERWDIGTDNFYTVGMIPTDSNGLGIINLRLNDAWYRQVVIYNGITYLTTEASKEGGTTKTLRIYLNQPNPYEQFNNIDYSFDYNNETSTFLFTFTDVSGLIATGCLRIRQLYANASTQIYYSCVYSSSGTLSYPLVENGTYVGDAIIKLNNAYGNIEEVVKTITVTKGLDEGFLIIGRTGYVAGFLLIGTLGLIGVASGSIFLGVVLVVAGSALSSYLKWVNIPIAIIYSLVALSILVVASLKRRSG